ncbi:hypothetical protein ILUMI_10908, partial [Ignelater luminosus]
MPKAKTKKGKDPPDSSQDLPDPKPQSRPASSRSQHSPTHRSPPSRTSSRANSRASQMSATSDPDAIPDPTNSQLPPPPPTTQPELFPLLPTPPRKYASVASSAPYNPIYTNSQPMFLSPQPTYSQQPLGISTNHSTAANTLVHPYPQVYTIPQSDCPEAAKQSAAKPSQARRPARRICPETVGALPVPARIAKRPLPLAQTVTADGAPSRASVIVLSDVVTAPGQTPSAPGNAEPPATGIAPYETLGE